MNLDFLIEMGWKSALIAGAALVIAAAMRRRAPADRAAVLQLAVVLLLATPVIAIALPALEVETPPAAVQQDSAKLHFADPMMQSPEVPAVTALPVEPAEGEGWTLPDMGQVLLVTYATGVALVLLRLLAGLLTLRRWARRADPVLSSEWTDALARAEAPGRALPRLLVSADAPAPMSWGLLRPIILLDQVSATRVEDADAIVTHEMAHIARRDWLSLLMARTTVALFWFNPLVWLLERDMFQQVEEAADASALGHVEPTRYAQTLVSCAHRGGGHVPANSMAASGLKRRVTAVLEARLTPAGSRWTLAAMIGCIAFAAPVAAVKLVEAAPEAPAAPLAPIAPSAPAAMASVDVPVSAAVPAPATTPDVPEAAEVPAAAWPVAAAAAPAAPTVPYGAHAVAAPAAQPTAARLPYPAPPRHYVVAPPAPPVMSAREIADMKHEIRASISAVGQFGVDADAIAEAAAAGASAAIQSISAGRAGMESGARTMEQSAVKLEHAAAQLRSKSHREKVIARERARGHVVSHEDLIDTAADLTDGARDLRDGAKDLRDAARDMAHSG